MGPVVFSNSGIVLDTSLAALFLGRRREYPLPEKLLLIKPKPPAPPTSPSACSPAPTPDSAPAPDLDPAPDPTPAPDPVPVLDPKTASPPEPDAAPPPAKVIAAPWTEIQDAMLRGLKDYQNKSWREIGALIEGRDSEECRERYDELEAIAIAEKKVKEEEEVKIKKVEEQAREEAEMRTWWAIHKAEKAKAAEAEQKAKEEEAKKEESMAIEKAKREEAKKEATAAERDGTKKEAKATRADKRAKEREAKKEGSDTAADTNPNKDKNPNKGKDGKEGKAKGKDKTTSSRKKKGKGRETRAKNLPHFNDTNATTKTTTADRPIINLEDLDEEEIEEAPLLWNLRYQSEAQKWNEMASLYFEATGQQVPAAVLEKELKSLGM